MPSSRPREMRGIVTVLNTPFTEDDRVDYPALQAHAVLAIEAGVAGFLVPALAAEVGHLTAAERLEMVRAVLEVAEGRVPVVGGASAATQAERVGNAEALAGLGVDVVLVAQPFEARDQYVRALGEVARAAGRPLMVQDWDASGLGVPVPALVEAFEAVPAFSYLKVETRDAGPKYTALKAATGGRLHVSGGWAVMQLIEALDRGIDAFMPTALNRAYCTIHRLYEAGKRAEAMDLFRRILPILAFSNQHLDHSIRFFKRLLWRQGVYPTPDVRGPLRSFDDHEARIADELIALAGEIEAALPAGR